MKLVSLTLHGTSDAGDFSGSIGFKDGLNIISADNGFGKSLIVAGLGWCLGLEPMVTISGPNDNSIFSEAVRSKIEIDGNKSNRVKSSFAVLEIEVNSNTFAKFTRPIIGPDNKYVTVELTTGGKSSTAKLIIGQGTLADETAGFQFHLFKLFGWPIHKLVRYNGGQTNLYFENLGPLFYIEQLGGWTDIQAEQISKYGAIDVAAHSFEYLLKLDGHYQARLQEHIGETHERELKKELSSVINEINQILKASGQHEQLSTYGNIKDLYERYYGLKISEELKEKINWSFINERANIQSKIDALRNQLSSIEDSKSSLEGFKRSSEEIAHLRSEFKDLESKLVNLNIQKRDEVNIEASLRHKIESASDLERFKTKGIGILEDHYSCPTCSQAINLQGTNLYDLSSDKLNAYIMASKRELGAIRNSIERTEADIQKLSADKIKILDSIAQIESKFSLLNSVVNQRKAEIIATVDGIKTAEREMEKAVEFNSKVSVLQERLAVALRNIHDLISKNISSVVFAEEEARLESFLSDYKESIKKLDLSVFKEDPQNIENIELSENYLPVLDGRLLKSFASASDQARIILPYLFSLAKVAYAQGRHPGFLILDEPLQQNPDEDRRPSMIKYFEYMAAFPTIQTLIFTSLESEEVATLAAAKINIIAWPKGRFLKPQVQ